MRIILGFLRGPRHSLLDLRLFLVSLALNSNSSSILHGRANSCFYAIKVLETSPQLTSLVMAHRLLSRPAPDWFISSMNIRSFEVARAMRCRSCGWDVPRWLLTCMIDRTASEIFSAEYTNASTRTACPACLPTPREYPLIRIGLVSSSSIRSQKRGLSIVVSILGSLLPNIFQMRYVGNAMRDKKSNLECAISVACKWICTCWSHNQSCLFTGFPRSVPLVSVLRDAGWC